MAGAAGLGGAGAQLLDDGGGAALPLGVVGCGEQAEVAAEFPDDVGDGPAVDVVFEVWGVQALP